MRVRAEVRLPVGRSDAWQRLIQWERQPEWMVDAVSVRVAGPLRAGVGARIVVRTNVLGAPLLTDRLEVTEWDPPRRLVMTRRGFVRGLGEWRLQPAGPGTRFVWDEQIRMPIPVLGELTLLLYRPVMRRLMQRSMANLAAALR